VSVTAQDEAPHPAAGAGFRDAVTFSFGDPAADRYGLARVGIGGDGASGLALVYAGGEVIGAAAAGGVALDGAPSWETAQAAGVRCSVETPLQAWTVSFEGDGEDAAMDLRFEALCSPAALDPEAPLAQTGGLVGYEQLCSVTGTVSHRGRAVKVNCLGQRGHLWGAPDWKRIELARALSAWMGADRAVMLTAVRPARSKQRHLDETVAAWLVDKGEPVEVFDPRLSTTYDGEQHQRRAGLELWLDEETGYARRAAGEVVCGTTLDLGHVSLDSAFFRWRMEGREGMGRYDVLRRN